MPQPTVKEHGSAASRYTAAVIKGGALAAETRKLLEHWRPGESLQEFTRRVQSEDLLGNSTACRTRDVVRKVFAQRLLIPTARPARLLKRIIDVGLPHRAFTEMLFVYACRSDLLVYDFTAKAFWPAANRGRLVLGTDFAMDFLSEAMADGRISLPWSANVVVRTAQGLMVMLRDVGFLRGTHRSRREVVLYRMSDAGVALLARELHDAGLSDAALPEYPDWALFDMDRADVLSRLSDLGESVGLIVQSAGSVVHITWTVKSMEELADVLARRNL